MSKNERTMTPALAHLLKQKNFETWSQALKDMQEEDFKGWEKACELNLYKMHDHDLETVRWNEKAPFIKESQDPQAQYRCHVSESWIEFWNRPMAKAQETLRGLDGKAVNPEITKEKGNGDLANTKAMSTANANANGCLWKPEEKSRLMINRGVRHGLEVLFKQAALQHKTVALPSDVYPVYLALAQKAFQGQEHHIKTYESQKANQAHSHQDLFSNLQADLLLWCEPLKPWGITGSWNQAWQERKAAIQQWKKKKPGRIVVVDGAYDHEGGESPVLQTIHQEEGWMGLYSLSKGWLKPNMGGVMILPKETTPQELEHWRNTWSLEPKDEHRLRWTWSALRDHPDMPKIVQKECELKMTQCLKRWAQKMENVSLHSNQNTTPSGIKRKEGSSMEEIWVRGIQNGWWVSKQGYLVASNQSVEQWAAAGIIACPASLWGGDPSGSVLSVL